MKELLFILLLTCVSFQAFSQIKFEPGYFINNEGIKTDCLIKNVDWRKNPAQFEYKSSESANAEIATMASVQEFAVNSGKKYSRYIVDIDRSSDLIDYMSKVREPLFEKDTLFLNVLVEGKATLYSYEEANLFRYFYSMDNAEPSQLVYKKYRVYGEDETNDKIKENIQFKSQLWKEVNCGDLSTETVFKTKYKKPSLVKYFVKYNECTNLAFEDLSKKQKRKKFNLTLRPGVNYAGLKVKNTNLDPRFYDTNFDRKLTFRAGIEAEFILPYNKNKWSVIIEPTFQYYNADKTREVYNASFKYSSIEIPFGVRYYMFLNDNSKLFTNISYGFDIEFNSLLSYDGSGKDWDLDTTSNFLFGVGYKFKDSVGIELRYNAYRELFRNWISFTGRYDSVSLIFGYSL